MTEDPLKDAESMLAAKLSGSNEKIERSSPCVSPKTGRSARRTRKAGKGNGSPTQQKRESKESSDDLVEEGMVSDSHGEENTEGKLSLLTCSNCCYGLIVILLLCQCYNLCM